MKCTLRLSAVAALLLAACVRPPAAQAGGSLGFAEIEPLLRQKPRLAGFLYQSFLLPDSAFAEVRLGPHFTRLSAYRLGPYRLRATPKGAPTPAPVSITLCTTHQFLDAAGKVIPEESEAMFQAVAFREELTAVVVRELSEENRGSGCP